MDWIDRLEEEAWNVVIDELVWHLREDRLPISIHWQLSPARGIEFRFKDSAPAFFALKEHALEEHVLEEHWDEAVQIIARFPQLQTMDVRSGA
ncbi:hypothetical protein H5368_13275 [Luteimonas sp. MC1782]|uniref:hypothetical protein n=1 Tax=Luteimonas sp. MC1782 TaxID=2760305 RepID=UPI001600718E|nr:hypothetical protein [Luteimonas sp. MC1782]MBB1474001.1 hypothetical protein [Luteimonas sp. MC1782]